MKRNLKWCETRVCFANLSGAAQEMVITIRKDLIEQGEGRDGSDPDDIAMDLYLAGVVSEEVQLCGQQIEGTKDEPKSNGSV